MRTTLRRITATALSILGIACSDSDPAGSASPSGQSKLYVVLSVESDTVSEGSSKLVSARVTDQTGLLKLVPVTWTSTNPAVASVSGGTITGVSTGTATVIASVGSGADSAQIVVTPSELVLDVQPTAAIIALGDTIDFIATTRDQGGNIVSVSQLTWSSSDTTAASFVNGGSLVAKAEGDLSVSAESGYRRGSGSVRVFRSPVASVTISPSVANVYKGAQMELVVTLRDQQGRLVEGDVKFGSSDPSKASVNEDGTVTGVAAGSVVITATSGTKTGSATVNVFGPPAASVSINLPSDTLPAGVEVQATVTVLDATGSPLSGKTIGYQSSNPSVATVNSTGLVKGIVDGSTTISAIVDGKIGSKRVSVGGRRAAALSITPGSASISAGQKSQLNAKVLDQMGTEMVGQMVSWQSGNPAVAQVSSTGLVTAMSPGSATITAVSGSLTSNVVVSVVSTPVASVQVTPSSVSIALGGSPVTLSASAFDASNNPLSGRIVTWMSQNPTVASVNASGAVTAIAVGSTAITANVEGKTATVMVTVGSAPAAAVASVTVSLASGTLNVGQQAQASAVLKDAQGNTLNRAITWSSLDTAVAKVSSSGLVTASGAGTVTIIAVSEGVSGYAALTVNSPAPTTVSSVTLYAPTQSLSVGQTVQSVVTLKDAQGNTLSGRTITYSTTNPSVVTVSATGVIKAVGPGAAAVKATSGGVTGSDGFTVTAATTSTLASITVNPATSSLTPGQSTQATAVAKDAQGNAIANTSFTWTTSNPSVATVSSSGLVAAIGSGSAVISASASGYTGSMAVTVSASAAAVASVTVSLSTNSLAVGGAAQGSVTLRDAQGNVLGGRPITYSSAAPSIATVSASGLIAGVAAGTAQISATSEGVVGSATLTVTAPVSTTIAAPQLPRVIPAWQDPYPGRACSVTVQAGGNIGTALSTARGGSVVCLTAGATYGAVNLPARAAGDTGWIVLRTATTLPAEGTRMRPSTAGNLAKIIITGNAAAALTTTPGTFGWVIRGVEIGTGPSVTMTYSLVSLGDNGSKQDTMGEVPQRLIFSQVWIHGSANGEMQRCVYLNSGATAIVDSWLSDCHGKGYDSQAIGGVNGPGPHLVRNNYLEGAGENVMWGGATPSLPGMVAADITFQRNHVYTPAAWKGKWTKKNLFELKNAVRVLIEDNVFDGSWLDGQVGPALVFKSINDQGNCNWCRTTDVTVRRSYVTNAGGGLVISGAENYNSTGTVDSVARRIRLEDVVFDNLNTGVYTGSGRGVQISSAASDIVMERTVTAGNIGAAMVLDNYKPSPRTAFLNNAWVHGYYFATATGTGMGLPTMTASLPGFVWQSMNVVRGARLDPLPAGTNVVTSEGAAPIATQVRATVLSAVSGVVVQP